MDVRVSLPPKMAWNFRFRKASILGTTETFGLIFRFHVAGFGGVLPVHCGHGTWHESMPCNPAMWWVLVLHSPVVTKACNWQIQKTPHWALPWPLTSVISSHLDWDRSQEQVLRRLSLSPCSRCSSSQATSRELCPNQTPEARGTCIRLRFETAK